MILAYSKKMMDDLQKNIIDDIEYVAFMYGATSGDDDEIMEHTWAAALLERINQRFESLSMEKK